MAHKASIALLLLVLPIATFSASFQIIPDSNEINDEFHLYLSTAGFVDIVGIDIVMSWDGEIIECVDVEQGMNPLPEFSSFYVKYHDLGMEAVLLNTTPGGFTGSIDSFLVLFFQPVSIGTTLVTIENSYAHGDPVLVDRHGSGIEVECDTAIVIVTALEPPPVIETIRLHQNYPNPFNPGTTIRFDVPERSPVTILVYDVGGRLVRTLLNGAVYEYGIWEIQWNGLNDSGVSVPSGVYFCLMKACGRQSTKKLVLVK
jgi:hypothetical protein